jgi:transposase-like protein
MASKQYENKAFQSYWRVHIEAWERSGLTRATYCRQHRLLPRTFTRWIRLIAGEDAARKHMEYMAELRREERQKTLKARSHKRRFSVSTDMQRRGLQAYWAMHIEAMNWSGMSIREYAAALYLSPTSLRKWRDQLENSEAEVDWRAHLHPSARPPVSTSANETPPNGALTDASGNEPTIASTLPNRRFFSDEQKRAIALETDHPGVKVSAIARKYGIVTGMLFRWRVQFGIAQKKRAQLAPATLADGTPVILSLRDLVPTNDGMSAVDLADERRVFAPADSDLDDTLGHVERGDIAP